NATLAVTQGTGTILNDDPLPSLSIGDVSVTEGNSGTVNAVFTVRLSALSGQNVTVHYATADGTAIAPGDYAAANGDLTITAGQSSRTITVRVKGDTLNEPDESFLVILSDPVHATLANSRGTGTILNDDPVSVAAAGFTVTGENCFPTNGVIDPGETVTVNFALRNASSGTDTVNLTATLQPDGGVASPSGPQTYGVLSVGGPAVAKPFTFTANGVCGAAVVAVLRLRDGASDLGAVTNVIR